MSRTLLVTLLIGLVGFTCMVCATDTEATSPNEADRYTEISMGPGGFLAVALKGDGTLEFWSGSLRTVGLTGDFLPPEDRFIQAAAGQDHVCAIRTDGAIDCWGDDDYGQATPPAGEFVQIDAAGLHNCAVRSNGQVACWGYDSQGQSTPPDGRFTSVSIESSTSCGVRTDGTITCWGDDMGSQSGPPEGVFTQIDVYEYHACGVRDDGQIICWGDESDIYTRVRMNVPDGKYRQVNVGLQYSCAVKRDSGSVDCWWYDVYEPKSSYPAFKHLNGPLTQISTAINTCGVTPDGQLECFDPRRIE